MLPPLPAIVAPPVDRTVATNLFDATSFLYSGPIPIQMEVVPGTIEAARVAVLYGEVLDPNGAPLPGVTISVADHPELGWTMSREDGAFDLAVNGGEVLTVRYEKAGSLPVERTVQPAWLEESFAPEVVMTAVDPAVNAVAFGPTAPVQVAAGSLVGDDDGTRQTVAIIPAGTEAMVVWADGASEALSGLTPTHHRVHRR